MQDVHEWLPFQVKHKIVLSDKNQATSSIPFQDMKKALQEFISSLQLKNLNILQSRDEI
jgi:predicted butyrate kinase (DUF1464 family)